MDWSLTVNREGVIGVRLGAASFLIRHHHHCLASTSQSHVISSYLGSVCVYIPRHVFIIFISPTGFVTTTVVQTQDACHVPRRVCSPFRWSSIYFASHVYSLLSCLSAYIICIRCGSRRCTVELRPPCGYLRLAVGGVARRTESQVCPK